MSNDKNKAIVKALQNPEQVALAYTVKTSDASDLEQFINDYMENIKVFEDFKEKHRGKWLLNNQP